MAVSAAPRRRLRLRRTWPQRLVLAFNVLLVLVCGLAAGTVWYGNSRLGDLERVAIVHSPTSGGGTPSSAGGGAPLATTTTLADGGPTSAQNFLLVGSDAADCIKPGDPDYASVGDRSGDRSDTIMVVRVEANASQAAILSFPRDLWVPIAGTGSKSKINSAFQHDDPSRLVQTIENNFSIRIDHYVEVSFCAFKNLVDALGGINIPFQYAARDKPPNEPVQLEWPAGCQAFDGESALLYVRSRYYQAFIDGKWVDGGFDYGRIARQQDFIKRVLRKALDRGAGNPATAKDLLDVALKPGNVRVDQSLTINDMLKLSGKLRSFDPNEVRTYRIDGRGAVLGGQSVIIPDVNAPTTAAILKVFRGEARIADTPEEATDANGAAADAAAATDAATTTTIAAIAASTSSSAATTTTAAAAAPGAATTVPSITVPPNSGVTVITPPADPTCR